MKINDVPVSRRKILPELPASKRLLGHPKDIIPRDWECSRVEAAGKRQGRPVGLQLEVLYPSKEEWKASSTQYGVGIPSSIVEQMLGAGQIQDWGMLFPDFSRTRSVNLNPCMKARRFADARKKVATATGSNPSLRKTCRSRLPTSL
jgi:saccharopine dehydrogenase-like NADP-dependent oxidoreductase